ncbi:MAG: M56 family metallopeptidase [Isosphaeraceae bacterium]
MLTSVIPQGPDPWYWIDRIGVLLFDATLSATLFFSLVLLAMLACRQPARRILIARVALLASLAIIPLVGLESLPRLDVVDILFASDVVPHSLLLSPAPGESVLGPTGETAIHGPVRRVADRLTPRSPWTLRWLERGLVILDLSGMGIGLAWLLLGFGGVRWLIRHSREPSRATLDIYRQVVADGLRATRCPDVRVSSRVQYPVVVGLLWPTILLPESLNLPSGTRESLRLSFLHELAHTVRSDHWFGTVASLAQSIWFFLPHTWWLRSQLMIDQEFLADCSAAFRYGTSSEYASSLLSMASRTGANFAQVTGVSGPQTGGTVKIDVPSALFQRMLMLLHCPFPIEPRTPRIWSWMFRLGIVGACIIAASLVIRWPDAGAVESGQKPSPIPTPIRFSVENFVAEPIPGLASGRSIAYVMPVLLPTRFDLDVEVSTSPSDLPQVRICGHPLTTAIPSTIDPALAPVSQSPGSKLWHRVHVHREPESVSIQLDGRPVSNESQAEPTSEWLTIEPGMRSNAEFRDLTLSW